jgi:transcription elongation factor Elf1
VKKVVQKLDTQFNCLFCNHESSIICTLDKKNNLGTLYCKICGQSFQTTINSLSKPVDVYTDWYDATEEVNQGQGSDDEYDENDVQQEKRKTDDFIEDDEEEEDGDYSD